MFFITKENVIIFIIKLFFFVEFEALYSTTNFLGLPNLCLMTMRFYTSLVIRILGIVLLLTVGYSGLCSGKIYNNLYEDNGHLVNDNDLK